MPRLPNSVMGNEVPALLQVTAWLQSTAPADLEILTPDDRLRELPQFAINLQLAAGDLSRPVAELVLHIRMCARRWTSLPTIGPAHAFQDAKP